MISWKLGTVQDAQGKLAHKFAQLDGDYEDIGVRMAEERGTGRRGHFVMPSAFMARSRAARSAGSP